MLPFVGPNQIQLASRLIPLVKLVMLLLLPISYPIAKMLDYLLHDEDEQGNMYNRGELAALVRIQYEERLAAKQRHRAERAQFQEDEGVPKAILDSSVRNVKREIEDVQRTNNSASTEGTPLVRSPSIHFGTQNTIPISSSSLFTFLSDLVGSIYFIHRRSVDGPGRSKHEDKGGYRCVYTIEEALCDSFPYDSQRTNSRAHL